VRSALLFILQAEPLKFVLLICLLHLCLWCAGAPTADELGKVRTRKPAPPVLSVEMGDGSVVPLWCTFSTQQVCTHGRSS
jgi:hypothetical protein